MNNASRSRSTAVPGVVARHVDGLPPVALAIIWPQQSTSLDVARFVAHLQDAYIIVQDAAPSPGHPWRPPPTY